MSECACMNTAHQPIINLSQSKCPPESWSTAICPQWSSDLLPLQKHKGRQRAGSIYSPTTIPTTTSPTTIIPTTIIPTTNRPTTNRPTTTTPTTTIPTTNTTTTTIPTTTTTTTVTTNAECRGLIGRFECARNAIIVVFDDVRERNCFFVGVETRDDSFTLRRNSTF